MATIYIFTNKTNGKQYVGQTVNFKRRMGQHRWAAGRGNKNRPLYNSLRKHGFKAFVIEHIDVATDMLSAYEIDLIARLDTKVPNGYNLTDGGEGTPGVKGSMKGKTFSKEHRDKISKALKGNKNCLGNKMSDKNREIMRQANLGKKHSEATKRKMSIAGIKRMTPDLRKRISEAKKGSPAWNKGKRCEQVTGTKNGNSRDIFVIHPEGKEEYFECLKDACDKYNLASQGISNVLNGKRNHHKGYRYRYA